MPSSAISEMREWIKDCSWSDLDPEEVDELDDDAILGGIERNYEGGIRQFLLDQ